MNVVSNCVGCYDEGCVDGVDVIVCDRFFGVIDESGDGDFCEFEIICYVCEVMVKNVGSDIGKWGVCEDFFLVIGEVVECFVFIMVGKYISVDM